MSIANLIRRVRRLCHLSALLGPFIAVLPTQAQDFRQSTDAPPSWGQFAKLVKYRFESWISADDPVANRFRDYLTGHVGKEGGLPSSLMVRVWVNPDGTVERVAFPPLPDQQADADLCVVLKRGNIGEAPPPEMLQPLNLRFSLDLRGKS